MYIDILIRIVKINILSNLSNIPPWLPKILEKSLALISLLMYEKYKSPKKKEDESNIENKILYSKYKRIINDIKKDNIVPDQVFFGLIEGTIKGPLIKLPQIYAVVSLTKERIITKKNRFLFIIIRLKNDKIKKIKEIKNNIFIFLLVINEIIKNINGNNE
tara:strand:- start:601 stop:1083 length:483 start_codon:yes stop_codon:yes gene_type:complete